jgi:hypothetical protein
MTTLVLVIVGLAVVALVLFAVSKSRGVHDGVDSFRRQIDALSPEARRPVIDQMYHSDRKEPRIDPQIDQPSADAADDSDSSADTGGPDAADEDGAHGA